MKKKELDKKKLLQMIIDYGEFEKMLHSVIEQNKVGASERYWTYDEWLQESNQRFQEIGEYLYYGKEPKPRPKHQEGTLLE
jgi:hypothetical protein